MKQLTCEMCGSTDLMKHEGVFECQSCGCKYSVEEAKRMMIEGSVDVSGSTVKVDNTAFIQKSLANARRAKEKTDWEEVEKYYNHVEQYDPENIEAIFYSSYGKVMLSLADPAIILREQKFNAFIKSISVIDDYYEVEKTDELMPLIQGMSDDITKLVRSNYAYNKNEKGYTDLYRTRSLFLKVEKQFVESIENILEKDEKAYLYHILIKYYSRFIRDSDIGREESEQYVIKMRKANRRLSKLDPSYQPMVVPEINVSGACYVATSIYNSYDCPQVWTLRRFRDFALAKTWYGRVFICIYYAISPTFVKRFGHTEWFKKMGKAKLDQMVADLNAKGVADTPYED